MLPDEVFELLTAAADGELSPAERDRVRLLLAESPSASALYLRLKADRKRLRALPHVLPPAGLHERIMAALPPVAEPAAPAARPVWGRRSAWAALAASVAVVAGAAVVLAPRPAGSTDQAVAQNPPPKPRPGPKSAPAPEDPPPVHPVGPGGNQAAATPAPTLPAPDRLDGAPRPVERDLSAFPPVRPLAGFDLARVRVPLLAPLADLGREDIRQALAEALARDPAVRIDLFAKDPARGVELVQAAGKPVGLAVQTDAATQGWLKRRQGTAYLVYTEALTAAEVRNLLVRLAADDGAAPGRVFDFLHLTGATAADAKDLKELVGADLGPAKRLPADPAPLSAGTGDQLAKTLAGGKDGEKPAVVVTVAPARTVAATSAEARQFLQRRGDRRPAAVPVLLVVRQSGG